MVDPSRSKVSPKVAAKSRWGVYLRRYSPHGEMQVSTLASIGLHGLVIAVFALGLASLAPGSRRPPSVDCIAVVGEGDTSAPGFGDDGLPSGAGSGTGGDSGPGPALEQAAESASADAPLPEMSDAQVETQIPQDSFEEADVGLTVPASSGAEVAAKAADARRSIKDRQRAALAGGGGGTRSGTGGDGTGGGGKGGSGGRDPTGRAGRQSRWILRFSTRNAADYLDQMRGLGAAIAFPTDGGKLLYLDLTNNPPARSTRQPEEIARICWYDEDPGSARRITEHLGLPPCSMFLTYLPEELESRMLKLELAFRGRTEDRIRSTQFEVVRTGGGYDVQVIAQESY